MSVRGDTMSDTMSDCTGRGSSLGSSREDLQDFAISLGLASAGSLSHDRFRVDRRRLENLLFGTENPPDSAATFFSNIMQETRTYITWPSRLKLGAKSKKDPHIRVIGRPEDVKVAREKILATLDTRGNRVNMKIDVSYTDHSHIIGKGGMTIKKVMEETRCHIHFPDSNRSNATEKSNQVSIAGEVSEVERARAKVRELTPLMFCFELPVIGAVILTPDSFASFIKPLQESHNIQVMFRSRQKLNATLVVVKGCEWEVDKVKEATQILINHMCDSLPGQVPVHMMVEISPQHHHIVMGRHSENLRGIMQRTKTQITFLDPNDPNIPSLKKSNVTITGPINNVYLARQQLIGSLPVVLMFDVPENSVTVETEKVSEIMNKLDVLITTRSKPKQNIISFIVKGIERNIGSVYDARRMLIAPNDPPITAQIPQTYQIPNGGCVLKNMWSQVNGNTNVNFPNLPSPTVLTPTLINHNPDPWSQIPHYHMSPLQLQPLIIPPSSFQTDNLGHFSYSSLSLPERQVYSSLSSNASTLSSPIASPRTVSPTPTSTSDFNKSDILPQDSDKIERKAPGFDRPLLTPAEYQKLKIQATQAIQQPLNPNEKRKPTPSWSGYGFSRSSPSAVLKEQKAKDEERSMVIEKDNWLQPPQLELGGLYGNNSSDIALSASNYLDSVSPASLSSMIACLQPNDLPTLLASVGLDKYTRLFVSNEVDLSTFRTLNELDLKEIGVVAFGARKKMLLCIAELNRRQRSPFRGSAAPGAERETSSTSSLNDNW